jgi:hypothetical protein
MGDGPHIEGPYRQCPAVTDRSTAPETGAPSSESGYIAENRSLDHWDWVDGLCLDGPEFGISMNKPVSAYPPWGSRGQSTERANYCARRPPWWGLTQTRSKTGERRITPC